MNSSFISKLLTDYFIFLKNNYFPFLVFAYFLYLLYLIFRTTYFIDGVIYFSLFDDAMISMRYAKNLAEGHGLVWNIGERIEGFSNPLWTLYMSFWHLLKIPSNLISLPIQLTNVLLLMVNLIYVKKITELISKKNELVVFISVVFTASYFSINNWAVLGTETTPLMLISTVSIFLLFKCLKKKNFSTLPFLLLGIGTLIRIDFFAIYVAFVFAYLVFSKSHKLKIIIWSTSIFVILMLINFLPRIIYYGEYLPNTYYLKMTGFPIELRLLRGLYTFFNFLLSSGIIFVLPFFLYIKKKKYSLIILLFLVTQFKYSLYVGGDVWEYFGGANRYITVVMPLYFVLIAYLVFNLRKKILKSFSLIIFTTVLLIAHFLLLNMNGKDMARDWMGLTPHQIVGANKLNTQKALEINKIVDKNSKVALEWAGVMPYFSNEMYHVDILGKNDKYIARLYSDEFIDKSDKPYWDLFLPGHTKWNYEYSIIEKKPEIIAQVPFYFSNLDFLKLSYEEIKVGDDKIYLKLINSY